MQARKLVPSACSLFWLPSRLVDQVPHCALLQAKTSEGDQGSAPEQGAGLSTGERVPLLAVEGV